MKSFSCKLKGNQLRNEAKFKLIRKRKNKLTNGHGGMIIQLRAATSCLFEIRKIAVCFLWLSLPGDYRVTDEALLAETTQYDPPSFL